MPARPRLRSTYRPLHRGDGRIQLGWGHSRSGAVLEGLDPVEVAFVRLLDGSRDEAELLLLAPPIGVATDRAVELIGLLRRHGLLAEGPDAHDRADLGVLLHEGGAVPQQTLDDLAALLGAGPAGASGATPHQRVVIPDRSTRQVLVTGRGPVSWELARRLRLAGIGKVSAGPAATDAALQTLGHRPSPHLVVLVVRDVVMARDAIPWRNHDIPVLPVVVGAERIVVGPLVAHVDDPCLGCLDLVRADFDPAWPTLFDQLTRAASSLPPVELSSEGSLTAIACGVVGLLATAALDGASSHPGRTSGISVEMSLPWPRLDHRRWPRHPRCRAHESSRTGSWADLGDPAASESS